MHWVVRHQQAFLHEHVHIKLSVKEVCNDLLYLEILEAFEVMLLLKNELGNDSLPQIKTP